MSGLTEREQVALCAEDYPLDFINGQHPGDYVETGAPIEPKCIYHHVYGKFNRLWYRVSWKLSDGKYTTMSFLLDTGAPKHLYLSSESRKILVEAGLLNEDSDMDLVYVKLFGRDCPVEPTPGVHAPANIIGLKLLKRFGLELFEGEPHFGFKVPIPYLDS
ncbi:hypothetical protein HXX76_015003 [Chlamydomonas incerta]|uniref:Uncharacterized protein n=1 Tax=Chlamydomonas incerta TaxID=51695 RepID=A0A835SI30_CHLIN|nr:hypothetical protein HXX76_015003 [Chlamydomonas incerta]|eukprot:KAG2423843.1 hypothetical protein HXX76_015003 [Chlamydomonas incerta]